MNARTKFPVLLATACVWASVYAPRVAAQGDPVHPEFLHGMVVAAQTLSERGRELQAAGKTSLADEVYDQALNLLVDADERSGGQHKSRFDRIYTRFYESRAAADPERARDQVRVRSQIESAYQGDPVQPGQVDYMVSYMARHKKQFLENSFRRSLRYIPMIRAEFEAQGIPVDLAYMALVESGFRPDPTSHVGAQGLWQFMPATGRQYGLRVADGVDERNDPVKATRAAGKYLRALYKRFGNWPLAVAAYNCGEGRVERSLRKHNVDTFWELADVGGLPRETQQYVPSIVAATIISRDPGKYGIDYP